jgi:excisionase family DNA binding protein
LFQMGTLLEQELSALTVGQVARRLQVDAPAIRGLIRRGELRAIRIGRSLRVPIEALDEYLNGPRQADGPLTAEDLTAIQRGIADIQAGRTTSWRQVKHENGI